MNTSLNQISDFIWKICLGFTLSLSIRGKFSTCIELFLRFYSFIKPTIYFFVDIFDNFGMDSINLENFHVYYFRTFTILIFESADYVKLCGRIVLFFNSPVKLTISISCKYHIRFTRIVTFAPNGNISFSVLLSHHFTIYHYQLEFLIKFYRFGMIRGCIQQTISHAWKYGLIRPMAIRTTLFFKTRCKVLKQLLWVS